MPPTLSTRLVMLAGVAACEAVEMVAGVPAALKWPNDVLAGGKKVGGILLESGLALDRLDFAVLGLGLNVSQAPPPEGLDFPATALEAEAGRPVDRLKLLRASLDRLAQRYPEASAAGDDRLFAAWRERLVWLGQPVTVRTQEGEWSGQAQGVDGAGALLVRLNGGEVRRVLAGDVSLRPAGDGS
jgi:BirA family biotin operon repressor/biotin-[acetyl-CoA-carboxylase] ligase